MIFTFLILHFEHASLIRRKCFIFNAYVGIVSLIHFITTIISFINNNIQAKTRKNKVHSRYWPTRIAIYHTKRILLNFSWKFSSRTRTNRIVNHPHEKEKVRLVRNSGDKSKRMRFKRKWTKRKAHHIHFPQCSQCGARVIVLLNVLSPAGSREALEPI